MTEVINVGYNNQDIFLKSKYSSINSIMTSNISFYEKIDNLKKLYNWKNCNNNYEKFIVLKEIFKNTKSWITDRTDECYSKCIIFWILACDEIGEYQDEARLIVNTYYMMEAFIANKEYIFEEARVTILSDKPNIEQMINIIKSDYSEVLNDANILELIEYFKKK